MRTSACFRGKLKNSRRYHSSKSKKIRDRVDSRVQLIWKLRVIDSWWPSIALHCPPQLYMALHSYTWIEMDGSIDGSTKLKFTTTLKFCLYKIRTENITRNISYVFTKAIHGPL